MSDLQNKINSRPEKVVESTDYIEVLKRYVENGYIYEYYQKIRFADGPYCYEIRLVQTQFVPGHHMIEELKK